MNGKHQESAFVRAGARMDKRAMQKSADLPTVANQPGVGSADAGLIFLVLFAWSTSWIALHWQLGPVAPEISVLWRFLIAGLFMAGWCLLRGEPLRFSRREHVVFAVLGVVLFSLNFVLFYHAGTRLVSGLLSVVFALVAPGNVLMQALFLRRPVPGRVGLGAVVGVFGLCLLFFPDIRAGGVFDTQSLAGLLLACCGTLSFCTGNFLSARLQARGVPIASASAWGMLYGAGFLALYSALSGLPFTIEATPLYLGSLLWSALVSSVLAFGAYLSLLGRIGPARAGYLTVLIPVFALAISALLEGYAWTLWSFLGLAAVGAGNVLVLRRG